MVMAVPAPSTLGAYQISVVVPLPLAACDTRDQVAPGRVGQCTKNVNRGG